MANCRAIATPDWIYGQGSIGFVATSLEIDDHAPAAFSFADD
jgi:hypothetical protein